MSAASILESLLIIALVAFVVLYATDNLSLISPELDALIRGGKESEPTLAPNTTTSAPVGEEKKDSPAVTMAKVLATMFGVVVLGGAFIHFSTKSARMASNIRYATMVLEPFERYISEHVIAAGLFMIMAIVVIVMSRFNVIVGSVFLGLFLFLTFFYYFGRFRESQGKSIPRVSQSLFDREKMIGDVYETMKRKREGGGDTDINEVTEAKEIRKRGVLKDPRQDVPDVQMVRSELPKFT